MWRPWWSSVVGRFEELEGLVAGFAEGLVDGIRGGLYGVFSGPEVVLASVVDLLVGRGDPGLGGLFVDQNREGVVAGDEEERGGDE